VGIRIKEIEEGCCDELNNRHPLKGDRLDDHQKTIDNILECDDKYVLIEERSFIMDFFRKASIGRKKFSHFIRNGVLEDDFFVFLYLIRASIIEFGRCIPALFSLVCKSFNSFFV